MEIAPSSHLAKKEELKLIIKALYLYFILLVEIKIWTKYTEISKNKNKNKNPHSDGLTKLEPEAHWVNLELLPVTQF